MSKNKNERGFYDEVLAILSSISLWYCKAMWFLDLLKIIVKHIKCLLVMVFYSIYMNHQERGETFVTKKNDSCGFKNSIR